MNEIVRDMLVLQVEIASAYDLLDWGGDDWPQPKAAIGIPQWDWDRLEPEVDDPLRQWRRYWQRMMKVD